MTSPPRRQRAGPFCYGLIGLVVFLVLALPGGCDEAEIPAPRADPPPDWKQQQAAYERRLADQAAQQALADEGRIRWQTAFALGLPLSFVVAVVLGAGLRHKAHRDRHRPGPLHPRAGGDP